MRMFPVSVVLQMLEQLTAGQIVGRQIWRIFSVWCLTSRVEHNVEDILSCLAVSLELVGTF